MSKASPKEPAKPRKPAKGKQPRKEPPSPEMRHVYSWDEFEGIKSRAACALDRVEFLAKSMDKFTEFKIDEARHQELILRQRSTPALHLQTALDKSKPGASRVFDKQRALLMDFGTSTKRLDVMNKYVFDQEGRKGKPELQAAKLASKNTKPTEKAYPLYTDLYDRPMREEGQRRMASSLAVMVPLPYEPPESALRHGMGAALRASGTPKGSDSKGKTADGGQRSDADQSAVDAGVTLHVRAR
eukprot:CAMPEP_0203961480 /NCGR_PEP_ID=MMETSP0359-20131031/91909_1 /ASSEMBLY_ACC=CAM_ASM_000338 /TAXON_ID=268821 /ORGANISM="Scrippsiella Hangoei, Strain SHTV-5" /LENGTH=242 /DNA_ID=CAMNT_0050896329 /DNA_START=74 /DNA_END=799 /DNA_ORIENTATION=-